jgi:DNA adenine methylase
MSFSTRRGGAFTPLRYIGGKHYLAPWHVSRFAAHARFVDVCVGGGSVLLQYLATCTAPGNVIANDLSHEVMNFWGVLREQRDPFLDLCRFTPLSRALVADLEGAPLPGDPVRRAWRFFVLNRQAFSGTGTGRAAWHWSISGRVRRGINESVSAFLSAVDRLPEVAAALQTVALECDDMVAVIRRFDAVDTLFYVDPPYFLGDDPNTHYEMAFTIDDHRRLADVLRGIQGRALICGYASPLYDDLYAGWRRETQPTTIHAATTAVKNASDECIWTNYDPPGVA